MLRAEAQAEFKENPLEKVKIPTANRKHSFALGAIHIFSPGNRDF